MKVKSLQSELGDREMTVPVVLAAVAVGAQRVAYDRSTLAAVLL